MTAVHDTEHHQPRLDLKFEGEDIEVHELKLTGDPETAFDAQGRGALVAFLVLGRVDAVTFKTDDADRLVRREKVKMRRAIGVPYDKAIEMFDRFDRDRLEQLGVRSLFDPQPGERGYDDRP